MGVAFIGAVLVLLGAAFLLLAAIGLVRMPDVYNRMQAGTKATTLGSMLVFAGFLLINPGGWSRYLVLIVFVLLTNPLSSHALARSARNQGVPAAAAHAVNSPPTPALTARRLADRQKPS